MDYQIALSPELGLSPEDLVAVWNETPECRDLAEATLAPQQAEDYILGPPAVGQVLVLLASAAGSLAVDALKDVLKEKLTEFFKGRLSPPPAIQVQAVRQPGGAYLLVVTEQD